MNFRTEVNSDPLDAPFDLDGGSVRGWEAVATSYFLVTNVGELHDSVAPANLRLAYCLYDPTQPIDSQAQQNAEGCSPRKAWDEWDQVSASLPITNVLGIPLPGVSLSYPVYQEHPDNRQLGIRQAQAGVARLALGPIVALFPIIEANIGLMLTLAASFIYLTMPLALLFSFFVYTEAMVTRLLLQWIAIFIRTLILNGLIVVFLLMLMGAAASRSLTVYLGLVGVGIVGGFFLIQMASSIMKESLSQSLGAVGAIWRGTATATLGEGARRPAEAAFGAVKLAATGATLAATASGAGALGMVDMADPAQAMARSGLNDIRGKGNVRRSGQTPESIRRLANKRPPGGWEVLPSLANRPLLASRSPKPGGQARPKPKEKSAEGWAASFYEAKQKGHSRRQIESEGRNLFGENLSRQARAAMERRSQAETMAALKAAQSVANQGAAAGQGDDRGPGPDPQRQFYPLAAGGDRRGGQ